MKPKPLPLLTPKDIARFGGNRLDSSSPTWDDEQSQEDSEPMTLCIAAECEYRGFPAIVLLADSRSQTGNIAQPDLMIVSDDANKVREFKKTTVLLAGSHARAFELSTACKPAIQEFTETDTKAEDLDIAVTDFLQKLRVAARAKKREIVQNFVENSTGIPHSDFIKLPSDNYLETWNDIRRLNLGADILISHVKHEPVIVRMDRWGDAHWEHNYGAIGNGAEIARAILGIQRWDPSGQHGLFYYQTDIRVPLQECVFRLFEAHQVAHKSNPSSVGPSFQLQVLMARHRGEVKTEILGQLGFLCAEKLKIPKCSVATDPNRLLFKVRLLDTDSDLDEEPDEL